MERRTKESKSGRAYDAKEAAPKANWYLGRSETRVRSDTDSEAQRRFDKDLRTAPKAFRAATEISRAAAEQLRQVKEELRVAAEQARREAEEMRRVIRQARRVKQELLAVSERLQEAADEHTAILTELSRQKRSRSSSKD